MKKYVVLVLALSSVSMLVRAQELWLLSSKSRYALNEDLLVAFLAGSEFAGEPWDLAKHKIERLDLYRNSGVADLRKEVQPSAKIKLKVKMTEPGTGLVAMQSEDTPVQMSAEKFNAYLKEEGLENVLKQRTQLQMLAKPAREVRGRVVKMLVQTGDKTDATFKSRVGLRLEIVPLQNPYDLHPGDQLDCLVLADGKPSPHQLVKVWNKVGRTSFRQDIYTEKEGTIRFPINAAGRWMVSTVSMIPSEKPGADWQSTWSSLVFGIN